MGNPEHLTRGDCVLIFFPNKTILTMFCKYDKATQTYYFQTTTKDLIVVREEDKKKYHIIFKIY